MLRFVSLAFAGLLWSLTAHALPTVTTDALEAYFEFADYGGGVIMTEQIEAADYARFDIIDTRHAEQYAAGHLPNARHIEWRQIFARRAEIPRDRLVLLYCNTGMLSAQAHFSLRLEGYDNVRVLLGGYQEWLRRDGPKRAVAGR